MAKAPLNAVETEKTSLASSSSFTGSLRIQAACGLPPSSCSVGEGSIQRKYKCKVFTRGLRKWLALQHFSPEMERERGWFCSAPL